MSDENKKLLQNNNLYPVFAAVLTAVLFLTILAFSSILGYGNRTILSGDLYAQYTAFIRHFLEVLKGKGNLYYSFSIYLGNPAASTFAYYCLSPFNLLYLIPGISMSAMTILVVTLKLSLAAASFQLFQGGFLKNRTLFSVMFSVCYALSSFSVMMSMHIMWLDALYILPVLILLIARFVNGSSFLPLIPAYALLFLTNFYMGYIAGIFSALCFMALLVRECPSFGKKELQKALKKGSLFALSVLLAAACCAAILLPAAYELLNGRSEGASDFAFVQTTIPDVINNLFLGGIQGLGSPIPLIYCGLPALLLLPLFFSSKRISRRDKALGAALLLFYLAASQFLPVYRFLHAFEAPNWYAHRYAFCAVFLLLTLASAAFPEIDHFSLRKALAYVAALLLLYAVMIPLQHAFYSSYPTNSYGLFLLNGCFLGLYLLLAVQNSSRSRSIACLLLCAELVINGATAVSRNDFGYHSEEDIASWERNESTLIPALLEGDPGFYRIRVLDEHCLNAPSRFHYPGLNSFATVDNAKLRSTLSALGIGTSFMTIYDHGYTDLTDMLLGVKYTILPDGQISGSPLALPVGFMSSTSVISWRPTANVFENQETLVNSITDGDYDFYTPLETKAENILTKNMDVLPFSDSVIFQHVSDLSANGTVSFTFPDASGLEVLGHITPAEEPVLLGSAPEIADVSVVGFSNRVKLSDGSIFAVPKDEKGVPTANLLFSSGSSFDYSVRGMDFVSYDRSRLSELYRDISANALTVTSRSDGELTGVVTSTEDRPILLITIPYAKGWEIYVDNNSAYVGVSVNASFMSLYLSPGAHEIRLHYENPFAFAGKMISGGALILCLIMLLIARRAAENAAKRKASAEEDPAADKSEQPKKKDTEDAE
ncbi:MAG: YfhO family protein [Lachnospiraceae bacterium]|nr:YfhO family protein [Lachnospiraceae bacterium]